MLAPALPGTGFRASHRALFQVSTPSGFNPSRLRDSARWAAPWRQPGRPGCPFLSPNYSVLVTKRRQECTRCHQCQQHFLDTRL